MSPTNDLLERYKVACENWPRPRDDNRVEAALLAHAKAIETPQRRVIHLAARAARGARGARDARAALAALDALAARAARAALDALAARAALAAFRWYWWDASYYAIYAVGARQLVNQRVEAHWLPILEALEAGLWLFWYVEDAIIWIEQPLLRFDDRHRLHCEDGPAFEVSDCSEYFWHGVLVTEQIVLNAETLTPELILSERNAEVRRVMIERFGAARLIQEAGAAKQHVDDFGTLWRLKISGDEDIVMVEVVNSTPEPDGSWKNYWLRVPPAMKTAREAVMWTHDLPMDAEPLLMT